jgi:hypothetical protein
MQLASFSNPQVLPNQECHIYRIRNTGEYDSCLEGTCNLFKCTQALVNTGFGLTEMIKYPDGIATFV